MNPYAKVRLCTYFVRDRNLCGYLLHRPHSITYKKVEPSCRCGQYQSIKAWEAKQNRSLG